MLIDKNTFTLLKSAINKDGWLKLPAYGNSMFPFIKQGNVCKFVPWEPSLLKKGDIVLFYSPSGQLIAHRYIRIKSKNNQQVFLLKGDTNLGFDPLISKERILGKLVCVQKQHLKINPDHFIPHLWGKMILTLPILSGILRKYLNRNVHYQY
jgi:signal peptidase